MRDGLDVEEQKRTGGSPPRLRARRRPPMADGAAADPDHARERFSGSRSGRAERFSQSTRRSSAASDDSAGVREIPRPEWRSRRARSLVIQENRKPENRGVEVHAAAAGRGPA